MSVYVFVSACVWMCLWMWEIVPTCVCDRAGGGRVRCECVYSCTGRVRAICMFVSVFRFRRVRSMCTQVCFVWQILMDVWNSAFPSSKTATDSTVLYMLESGEMTEQTGWQSVKLFHNHTKVWKNRRRAIVSSYPSSETDEHYFPLLDSRLYDPATACASHCSTAMAAS